MAKSVTINDVVKQMEARIGENGTYYWKKYGLNKGTPYCCASVSASFADAGAKKCFYGGKPVFYVPYAQEWLHKNAEHVKLSDVQRGDIVIFTWSGKGYNKEQGSTRDHIGFVRSASNGNTLYTIEGNTNGGVVAKRTRSAKYVYGVYRVKMPKTTIKENKVTSTSLVVDGIMGVKTKRALQKWLGVAEDGVVGKRTTKALQKKVGAKVDGIWKKETTKKLQEYLMQMGFKTPLDGNMDKATIKGLQRFLNTTHERSKQR